MVTLIIHFDILFKKRLKDDDLTLRVYRLFLCSLFLFFVTDGIWGILDYYHEMTPLRIDTDIYFFAMALSVFFWLVYIILYLRKGRKSWFARLFLSYGVLITLFALVVIIIDFFTPTIFTFDGYVYRALPIRFVLLGLQITVFITSSIYAFIRSFTTKDNNRYRYLAIGSFGVVMTSGIVTQTLFALFPLYSAEAMIAICVFQTFVVNKQKEELKKCTNN